MTEKQIRLIIILKEEIGMANKHDKVVIKIVLLESDAYRIDQDYYDSNNQLIDSTQGTPVPFQLFDSKEDQASRTFKPIILSFIDNMSNLSLVGNNLSGIKDETIYNLIFPSNTISESFILKAIAQKRSKTQHITTENDIKQIIIKMLDEKQLQITTQNRNEEIEKRTIEMKSAPTRTIIMPLIKQIWGEKNQMQQLIEETTLYNHDETLYYVIKGANGTRCYIEISPRFFDVYSIRAIEKEIYDEINAPKIKTMNDTIQNHFNTKNK